MEGVISRELADRPGLRVLFASGEERLYGVRALGFVVVVRLLLLVLLVVVVLLLEVEP